MATAARHLVEGWEDRYDERCRLLASTAGVINAAHGGLVDLAVECLAEGDHIGPGLHSCSQFLAWRLGVATATASAVARVAKRAGELPVLVAALRAGEISLDQAAVVARHVPAAYDRSATDLARVATVAQLKAVLPAYRDDVERPKQRRGVSITRDDDGWGRLAGELPPDQAAAFERALDAMREDLWRQRKADARSAAAETGGEPAKVPIPSGADALAAMAETASRAGEAAHPSTQRYLVAYHLQVTADGRVLLIDEHGIAVAGPERRRILCDHRFEAVAHSPEGVALSVGRATRHINRKLRRTILHRHRGRCAVPGCDATRGLEIHHIWHWEDGGPTDTPNLLPLCRHHHRAHHHGGLHITGNADLPTGTPGALQIGPPEHPLTPSRPRLVPTAGAPDTCAAAAPVDATAAGRARIDALRHELHHRLGITAPPAASTPRGEPLSRHGMHLRAVPNPTAAGFGASGAHLAAIAAARGTTAAGADDTAPEPSGPAPGPPAATSHHRSPDAHPPAGPRSPDGPPGAHAPPRP